MKRFTLFFAILSVLVACSAHAAQQPITTITSGTGTSGKTLKQYNDNDITPRLTYINENFTDLYTNAAFKSCFLTTAAWASCFPDLPLVGSDLSLSAIKTYIIDDATVVTGAEIGSVFTGTGEYLKKDGTTGDPPGGTGSGPTFLASDPTSPTDNSMWYNTTSNELKIATADGLWTDGTFAAWSPVDAFQFTNLTDQTADGQLKCSAAITPTGANHSWPVMVSGDTGCSVKIDGGMAAATGTYTPGDTVEACVNASLSASTTTSCTPSIGDVEATQAFSVTTIAEPIIDFEESGTPSGWTVVGGTVNFDYTSSYIHTAQSVAFEMISSADYINTNTSRSFLFKWTEGTYPFVDSPQFFVFIEDAASAEIAAFGLIDTGKAYISYGAVTATSPTNVMSGNTVYKVWIDFTPGTGNGTINVYIIACPDPASPPSKPVSPTVSITTGTSTTALAKWRFINDSSLHPAALKLTVFDDVK